MSGNDCSLMAGLGVALDEFLFLMLRLLFCLGHSCHAWLRVMGVNDQRSLAHFLVLLLLVIILSFLGLYELLDVLLLDAGPRLASFHAVLALVVELHLVVGLESFCY